jgi:hypothetical protein
MEWLLDARLTQQQLSLIAAAATEAQAGPGRLQQLQEILARLTLAVAAGRVELERLEAEVSPGVTSDGSPGAESAAAAVQANWDHHYSALRRFVVSKGRLPYQEDTWENKYLGKWCRAQQLEFEKGHLSDTQVTALVSVPGWDWDTPIMQRYQAEAAQRRQEDRGQRRHVRQQQQQEQQVARGSSRSVTPVGGAACGGGVAGGWVEEVGEQEEGEEEEVAMVQQLEGEEVLVGGSDTQQQGQEQQQGSGMVIGSAVVQQQRKEPATTAAACVVAPAAAGAEDAGSLSLQQQQQQQQQETFWGQGGVDDILDALEQLLQDQGWDAAPGGAGVTSDTSSSSQQQ